MNLNCDIIDLCYSDISFFSSFWLCFKVFEPSELERGHFTDLDQEIRSSDMPERFQLRGIPVCPTEEGELDEESEWIFNKAFMTAPLSTQDLHDPGERQGQYGHTYTSRRGPETVEKIRKALNFMRNQQFEVYIIVFSSNDIPIVENEKCFNALFPTCFRLKKVLLTTKSTFYNSLYFRCHL